MDSSALLFVALAVAWAVYLVPKALKHHDEAVRSRSVDRFSHRMRVLARREPVDRRNARLVVSPVRPSGRPPVETKTRASAVPPPAPVVRPVDPAAARASARRAAGRRRNVLALLVLANAVVVGLAAAAVVAWPWTALPAGLLVAWLVACRLSVRAERRARSRVPISHGPISQGPISQGPLTVNRPDDVDSDLTGEIAPVPTAPVVPDHGPVVTGAANPPSVTDSPAADVPAVLTGEVPVVPVAGGWDMVPTTLPTYVTKPAAHRRSVSTIDLDSTGVWSSGRHDGDSALARSAEQADQAQKSAREDAAARRASGA